VLRDRQTHIHRHTERETRQTHIHIQTQKDREIEREGERERSLLVPPKRFDSVASGANLVLSEFLKVQSSLTVSLIKQ
jgi:hypothetical protein